MDGVPWWMSVLALPVLLMLVAQVCATVEAISIPIERWRRAEHRKAMWVTAIWFLSPPAAAYYALRIRPKLRA